jgi:tetratricopeptide (TPR) repeat protein
MDGLRTQVETPDELVWPEFFFDLNDEHKDSIQSLDTETLGKYTVQAKGQKHYLALLFFCREFIRRDPENVGAWVMKGISEKRMLQYDEALATFEMLLKLLEKLGQDNSVTLYHMNEIRNRQARHANAEGFPPHYSELSPAHLSKLDTATIGDLIRFSKQAALEQNYSKVFLFCDELLRRDPEDIGALIAFAAAKVRTDETMEALKIYRKVNRLQEKKALNNSRTLLTIAGIERSLGLVNPVAEETASVREEVVAVVEAPEEELYVEPVSKIPEMQKFFRAVIESCELWEAAKDFGENWFRVPEEARTNLVAEFERYKALVYLNLPSSKIRSVEAKEFWARLESVSKVISNGGVNRESFINLLGLSSTVRELYS